MSLPPQPAANAPARKCADPAPGSTSTRRWIVIACSITVGDGLVGLGVTRGAHALGFHFPSFGYLAALTVWSLATLGFLVHGIWRYGEGRFDLTVLGYKSDRSSTAGGSRRRTGRALLAIAATLILTGPLALVGSSLGSGSSYGPEHHAGLPLVLAALLVRYPLTVFAEESLFRGWLEPKLGPLGPVISGVLFACYHLNQWTTIPSLIPLGILLGIIRWWRGNTRATSTIHYLMNAGFFLLNYA